MWGGKRVEEGVGVWRVEKGKEDHGQGKGFGKERRGSKMDQPCTEIDTSMLRDRNRHDGDLPDTQERSIAA